MEAEKPAMIEPGRELELLDTRCRGMAAAFGFEREKCDVSIGYDEPAPLPSVRNAMHEDFILAKGFRWREQIMQATNRPAPHLAQVLQMTLRETA